MAPCTHPGMKRIFCLQAKNGVGRFAPSALPHYNPSRPSWPHGGTLRLSSALTPECAVTRATHLGVSPHLPSNKEINLLRNYRPTKRENKNPRTNTHCQPPTNCCLLALPRTPAAQPLVLYSGLMGLLQEQ